MPVCCWSDDPMEFELVGDRRYCTCRRVVTNVGPKVVFVESSRTQCVLGSQVEDVGDADITGDKDPWLHQFGAATIEGLD